jgi:predicted metal-dependent enzyme (double-stranded beta helix superfamily)
MMSAALETFIAKVVCQCRAQPEPADCVLALAPVMLELLEHAGSFLEPQHYASDASGYTRNLIYEAADDSMSLYSLVWLPGQWTPVHDHGSWGVVGVLEGILEERAYVRLSPDRGANENIELVRGGVVLLRQGAVTTFVPNPDHIHMTGVPAQRPRAVSLHLYGRMMSSFNIYDLEARSRKLVHVAHNQS